MSTFGRLWLHYVMPNYVILIPKDYCGVSSASVLSTYLTVKEKPADS